MTTSSSPASTDRLHSLDILRGLDMLIILGVDAMILLLASKWPDNSILQEIARQMTHVRWEGLHLYDLVFPIFVFISGVSMSFSLAKYRTGNTSASIGILHLWKRALVLTVLGLLINGDLTWNGDMRYASVLGLIGFSCAIAGTCILLSNNIKSIVTIFVSIPIFITLLQFFCGDFTPSGSVNSWIDRHCLPGHLHGEVFDPEGPLCILSATSLCLGGWLTGTILKKNSSHSIRICLIMMSVGIILFFSALFIGKFYPIIKSMWTGSFILAAGGIALIVLSLFHLIADIWNGNKLLFPLRIIGVNALAAYLIHNLLNIYDLNHRIFCGLANCFVPFQSLFLIITFLLLQWLLLFFLYKRRSC